MDALQRMPKADVVLVAYCFDQSSIVEALEDVSQTLMDAPNSSIRCSCCYRDLAAMSEWVPGLRFVKRTPRMVETSRQYGCFDQGDRPWQELFGS